MSQSIPTNATTGARARVRAELIVEIKDVARRQLAGTGADGLSLRAVSRELGMASSALYRYFPSRDQLLTALIVDAYRALGDTAEARESAVRRPDLAGRFLATASAARAWAVEHRHEWALIFGSPIPGYAAPTDTIDPAARVPMLLLAIAADAAADPSHATGPRHPVPRSLHADVRDLRRFLGPGPGPDDHQMTRWIGAWIAIVGTISFELFGHLHNVITDHEPFFTHQMRTLATDLGLHQR